MKSMSGKSVALSFASAAFVLPSFILTVFFQAEMDWHNGTFGVVTIGMAVGMAVSVAGLPLLPFGLKKTDDLSVKGFLIVLFVAMLSMNYYNSVRALTKIHTLDVGGPQDKIERKKYLRAKLTELQTRKDDIPKHSYVSASEVATLEKDVADARVSKDEECASGSGWKCNRKEEALEKKKNELKTKQPERTQSEKEDKINAEMDAANEELKGLGHVPETADATAAQIAHILNILWPATSDGVSSNSAAYQAAVMELMGAGMPYVLFLVFGATITASLPGRAEEPRPVRLARTRAPRSKPEVIEEMQADPLATLPAPVRKPIARGDGGKASADASHLTLWWSECVIEGEGSRFQAKVFRQSYEGWCKVRGIKSVGPNPFGKFIVGEIGDDAKETDRGYTFYHGYKLKLSALQKVG